MSDTRRDARGWSESSLFGLLRSTRWLKMVLETSSAALVALAVLLGGGLIAVFADAVLALPVAGRVAVNLVLGAGVLAAAGLTFWRIALNRFDPRRLARLVEERLGLQNSVFINGVEFAAAGPGTGSPVLRERAIRMAQERAREVSSLDVVPFRPLYRAMGLAAAAIVVLIASWLTAPRLFAMVVPRYLDPDGDHPPYTLVEFDVRIAPEPVYHGRPATISATLGGPEMIEQAAVVFVDEEGPESVPMFRTDEQQFALQLERAEQSRRFYIDTPRGRSRTMLLEVLEVPWLEDARVAYAYPEYTGWAGSEQPLTSRGIRALAGTEVTLTARGNLPLKAGLLQLTPDRPEGGEQHPEGSTQVALQPDPDDPRIVRGAFPIAFSGRFELTLIATNGAESLERLDGPLVAVPDRPPHVSIVEPSPRVVVVEDWRVPVTIEAVDDVGIAQIRLYRSVNGWGPTPIELPPERARPNSARARAEFDLPELGARAGDVITYYASAYDNHPSGTQFRDSDLYVIQVISKREYQQFARQQYQMDELIAEFEAIREQLDQLRKQRQDLLEQLETLQKQLDAMDEPNEELLQKMEQLQEQLSRYSESAEQLAERLQERTEQLQLYELEEPYTEMLQRLSQQLRDQSRNAGEVGERLSQLRNEPSDAAGRQALEEAAEKFRRESQPFDEQMREELDAAESDLELYRMADELVAAAERMRSIIARQRELADRMGEFRGKPSLSPAEQARADRLAREQDLLQQELQEATEQMRRAAERAEERLPRMAGDALELCKAIGELGIAEDQRAAARQAREGAGQQAHEAAEAAARKLESLLSKCADCQGAANGMCNSLDGPLRLPADRLEQCLNQLAQGRGIPGVGGRPGDGDGEGATGQGGFGVSGRPGRDGAGDAFGSMWRPGQTFPGSQAPVAVLGPRTEQSSQAQHGGSRPGADGRGNWLPFGSGDDPHAAETLNPETREAAQSGVGNLRSVPVGYREAAEAYFRRLAEGK